MNPATGTFITMDEYAGSVFEPVSLHKYLYANANPVMNFDPTGYFTLGDINVSQAIENTLHNMLTPNFGMVMKWLNFFASYADVCNQIGKLLHNGGSLAAVLEALGRGTLSGLKLNLICRLNAFCPLIGKIVSAYVFSIQIERLNSAIEQGDFLTAGLVGLQLTTAVGAIYWDKHTANTSSGASETKCENSNPLSNIKYTDKVRNQAASGDYHGFPECADAFGADGRITTIVGADKIARTKVEIPCNYHGKDGVFEYIIDPDGVTCNHRLFVPNKK